MLSLSELREVLYDLEKCGILNNLGTRKFYIAHPINVYILASYYAQSLETDPLLILDAGCGIGYGSRIIAHILSKKERKFRIIGIDIDYNSLQIARNFLPQVEFKLIDLTSDDVLREFSEGSFDLIIASEVIEHIPAKYMGKFFKNMEYLLREGGILIISTPERDAYDLFTYTEGHINEMTVHELRRFIEEKTRLTILDHFGSAFIKIALLRLLTRLGMSARYHDERREFNMFVNILRGTIFNILFPISPDSRLMKSLPFNDITKMTILIKRRYSLRRVDEALRRGEIPTFQIMVLRKPRSSSTQTPMEGRSKNT